jgi:hypothetical protein
MHQCSIFTHLLPSSHLLETLGGLATIRAFGWVDSNLSHNRTLLDNSQRPVYLLAMIQQCLAVTLNLLVAGLAVILVIWPPISVQAQDLRVWDSSH